MITKELLEKMYFEDGLNQRQIGEKFGLRQSRISSLFKKYGIDTKKYWTEEQIKYLETNAGVKRISVMAKELGKTPDSVNTKMRRLGINSTVSLSGLITGSELANCFKVDRHVVYDNWIKSKGLKCIRKATKERRKFTLIDIDDFWIWAEKNKEKINFSKLEPLLLGKEPDWVHEKRKLDAKARPTKQFQKWTIEQDKRLKQYRDAGYTLKEIGQILGKSAAATNRRTKKLNLKKLKICLPWKDEEIKILISMRNKGHYDKEIAWELGRETGGISWKRQELEKEGRLKKLNKSEIAKLRKNIRRAA